jgi:hypothetical protein
MTTGRKLSATPPPVPSAACVLIRATLLLGISSWQSRGAGRHCSDASTSPQSHIAGHLHDPSSLSNLRCHALPDSRSDCRYVYKAQESGACRVSAPRSHLSTRQRRDVRAPRQPHHGVPSYPERYRVGALSGFRPGVVSCLCPPGAECGPREESGL